MKKKTVIITGGGRGIGEAITRAFFENGYNVVIGSRNDSGLVNKLGNGAHFIATDIRSPGSIQKLVSDTVKITGKIDVMINNAGFSEWRSIERIDEAFWDKMIDTNLKGTMFGCISACLHMENGASIINISSLAGKRGSANNTVYCASKFGINGLTQALAKELGPRGIRVNAVCPVYVKTEGVEEALSKTDSPAGDNDVASYLETFANSQAALKRLPLGSEIGKTCLFLASDDASAITGQCINVDCGVLPQ